MFSLIRYIVLFFFGYKLLKKIFTIDEQYQPGRQSQQANDSEPKQQSRTPQQIADGEYIDYEEIKD